MTQVAALLGAVAPNPEASRRIRIDDTALMPKLQLGDPCVSRASPTAHSHAPSCTPAARTLHMQDGPICGGFQLTERHAQKRYRTAAASLHSSISTSAASFRSRPFPRMELETTVTMSMSFGVVGSSLLVNLLPRSIRSLGVVVHGNRLIDTGARLRDA